jgi:hypothetical protein
MDFFPSFSSAIRKISADLPCSGQYLEIQQKVSHLTDGTGFKTQINTSYVMAAEIYRIKVEIFFSNLQEGVKDKSI